jgi:precorrin-8X/cobalt-precorrin-8 methylmutase
MARSSTSTQFDRILIIDWSAANSPKTGADSIWIADSHAPTRNPSTRTEAMAVIETVVAQSLARQERLLLGWDFAFGYPAGFAAALGLTGWSGLWAWLHARVQDDDDNRSNRFDVAAEMNMALSTQDGPFWGHVGKDCPPGLSPKRYPLGVKDNWSYGFDYAREAERQERGAKSVFQLAYNGSVGSQALLGIARLEGLRRRFAGPIAIWPFETDFAADISAPIICAEIYPSAHTVPDGVEVKDQRQVETVLHDFLDWARSGSMSRALGAPSLTGATRDRVHREEGWIVRLRV